MVLRFSKLAGISLGVVVVTGVARTVDELGGWARLADSGFGRALDLKLMLFAGLVALGAMNRYRLVPLFQAGGAGGPSSAAAQCRWGAGAGRWGAGGGGAAEPARPRPAGRRRPAGVRPAGPGGQRGRLGHDRPGDPDRDPGAAGPNRFTATVADFDSGTTLPVDRVELSGTPVTHPGLGTARLELSEAADAAGWARAGCCLWPADGT